MIGPFVSAEWLEQHRGEVAVVDVRWYLDGRSGRAAYEAGHLPGAVYLELGEVLSDPPSDSEGRHPLPAPERLAAGLGAAGIDERATVIGYDDAGGPIAARLVWLLRALGQPAALLDGGLSAWTGELETGPGPTPQPTTVPPRLWPEQLLVGIDEVAATDDLLVDGRDARRFAGGPDPVDPRSGHIPGARSLPGAGNLGADGRLLSPEELKRRFQDAGLTGRQPVISYCGSGVTACFNLLAMERAGLPSGRLYAGSWSQWSRDPERPIETGSGQGAGET